LEGVPYDKARALGPQAEPILLQLIDRQDMRASRSNIVVTLGILGSPAAVQRIITVLEAGSSALAQDEVQTRMDAVVALGYAANVAVDPTALNYLLSGTNLGYWIPPRIQWTLPDGGSPATRLRTRAISALGLSGKSDALQMLQQLQTTGGGRGAPPSEQALIAESIETNQYIAKSGLSQYYQTRRF
jgi:HEAT repeat protein